MRVRILLFIILLGLIAMPATAQESNSAIPACTPAQVAAMSVLIDGSGVLDEIAFISGRMAEGASADLVAIVADLDPYQRRWWDEVVPALPDCAFAYTTARRVGRFIDELLIGAAFTQIAVGLQQQGMPASASVYSTSVERRLETFQEISADLDALAAEFDTLTGVRNSSSGSASPANYVVISPSPANLRAAPNTQGDVAMTLQPGASVEVLGPITGEPVNGNSQWYEIRVNGRTLYVHSSLIGPAGTTAAAVASVPTTNQPVTQSLVPAAPPAAEMAVSPPTASCPGLSYTCSQLTCEEAYACLASGNRSLDRDGDGVPCESICPGG